LIDLAIAIVLLVLLLYRPGRYKPYKVAPISGTKGEVSPYLTHDLLPQLYNGAQRREPFDLVVIQEGINETIARYKWPQESEGIIFSAPIVLFVPESIILMGTANIKGVDLVITIVAEPVIDEDGLLLLDVTKVKIGAMNITPLAKLLGKRMYAERLATMPVDTKDLRTKIAASLLNDEPFEPVFYVPDADKKVRVEEIFITQGQLIARLVPAY